jgi:hypothetical protein
MHGVDHNLFDQIKIRKLGEFVVVDYMLLHKVFMGGGGAELKIIITESMMLLVGPVRECCSTSTYDIAYIAQVTHL